MEQTMDISALCNAIELHPEMQKRILTFIADFDFKRVDSLQKGYFTYRDMNAALTQTQALLGEDIDGVKILSCMLKAALDAYKIYQEKQIPDAIYFATMKCFSRCIEETYKETGEFRFDRYWWTTRQVGCHLFRIGELEYEIEPLKNETVISIHIPSDANFSPNAVERSLRDANEFFTTRYPTLQDAEYRCHSWLLDRQLKDMLDCRSNILHFQNRFEIINEGEIGTDFLDWLFQTKSTDYNALPENTSLQINVKKHLLSGGVIRNACGRIKKIIAKA